MPITLDGGTGLFDLLTEVFDVQTLHRTHVAARVADMTPAIVAVEAQLDSSGVSSAISGAEAALEDEVDKSSALTTALSRLCEQICIEMVVDDVGLPNQSITAALEEIISQMAAASESVAYNTCSFTLTPGGSNTGDAVIIVGDKRADGTENNDMLDEDIVLLASVGSSGSPVLSATGEEKKALLAGGGFGGSGVNRKVISVVSATAGIAGSGTASSPILTNTSTLPGSWVVQTGSLGSDVVSGAPQEWEIVVTGTPTSGTYRINVATTALGTQSTIQLAYNATAAQIQTAIRALTGFANAVVSATGTAPNYTHTIKFYGTAESATVTVVESTDSGTYTPSETVAFSAPSLGGAPIIINGDGSTTFAVAHRLTHLRAGTRYAVNAWLAVDAADTGTVTISLTDGLGGSVLTDKSGGNLSYTVDVADLTTAYQSSADIVDSGLPVFSLPDNLPSVVYLQIKTTTAMSSGRDLIIDGVSVVEAVELYPGGPTVTAFAGSTGLKAADTWTIAVTNSYDAYYVTNFERNFAMRDKGLVLPQSGSPTIT